MTDRRFWCGALVAFGCAPAPRALEPTAALAVDAAISTPHARVIMQAAEAWSPPTHGWVSFSWSPDGFPILAGSCPTGQDACQTPDAIYVTPALLAPTARPEALYCAVLHELGHGLGLGHSPEPDSVMHNPLALPCAITPNDAQNVVDIGS